MNRFGQIIHVIALLNSIFVVTFGMLYLNGGSITRDDFVGSTMITMGVLYVVGFIVLFTMRIINNRRQLKELRQVK